MTTVKEALLPKTELGNDPSDNRQNKNYLDPIQVLDSRLSLGKLTDVEQVLLQNPSEDKVAVMFAERHEGNLIYSHQHASWFIWDSSHWRKDETLLAQEYVRQLARKLNTRGLQSLGRSSFARGVESLAKADRKLAVHGKELDQNHYLLNTPAGTLNLEDELPSLRAHNPADLITKATAVGPSEEGGVVFKKFLDEVTLQDGELQKFLRRALGSMLSGACEEHWLMFWIGEGRNGKNTLGDVVQHILGGYAKTVPSSTLLSRKSDSHPTELANLQGCHLAVSSEIPEGSFLNEARVKELTGDATISARYMRQDYFEFQRTHKHLVYGNSRPQLRSVDPAIRSRLKIVPFQASFAGREDPDLPTKLVNDAGYILRWLIDGHQDWMQAGKKIGSCSAVDDATGDYFSSQSTPEMWLEECCRQVPDEGQGGRHWHKSSELYKSYRSWKIDRGESPVSQTRWGDFMSSRYRKRSAGGVRYVGLLLQEYSKW